MKSQLECKELLRKSSMKSSYESRETRQKLLNDDNLIESRTKSEGGNNKI